MVFPLLFSLFLSAPTFAQTELDAMVMGKLTEAIKTAQATQEVFSSLDQLIQNLPNKNLVKRIQFVRNHLQVQPYITKRDRKGKAPKKNIRDDDRCRYRSDEPKMIVWRINLNYWNRGPFEKIEILGAELEHNMNISVNDAIDIQSILQPHD